MDSIAEQIRYSKLPDQVTLGINLSIGKKEIQQSIDNDQSTDYDYIFTVGQKITHTAIANVPILSVRWVINGGAPISHYTISANAGVVDPLTAQMLVINPLIAAYTTAAEITVGVYITTSYGTGYTQVSVLMTTPEVNIFEAATEQVYVGPYAAGEFLRFGNPAVPAAPGITINAVTYGRQSVAGTLGILQLATNMRFGMDADGINYHWNLNGQAVLDVGPGGAYVFYQNVNVQLDPGKNAQFDITDAPAQQLGPPFNFVSIGDGDPIVPESYQSYLMFRANTPGSIYVPIAVLNWYWAGYTQLVGGAWSPVQDPENAVNPIGVTTNVFPTWNNNTNTGRWVQGMGRSLKRIKSMPKAEVCSS